MQKGKESPNEHNAENQRRPLPERRWVQFVGAVASLLVIVTVLMLIGRRFGTDDLPQFVTGNLINVLIFAAIVGQVLIYRNQRDIMQQQREAMYSQLDIMDQGLRHNLEVSKIQFEDMQIQWKSMGQQIDAMNNQTGAMINQSNLMLLSLEETRKIVAQNERAVEVAESNVEAVERTSIYASRAYVAATIAQIEEGFRFHLYVANSGNTPANNVRVSYAFELRETPPIEKVDGQEVADGGYTRYEALGLILPRDGCTFVAGGRAALTHDEFKLWKANRLKCYCWGVVLYEDIFQEKRCTWFCFYQSFVYPNGQAHEYGNLAI